MVSIRNISLAIVLVALGCVRTAPSDQSTATQNEFIPRTKAVSKSLNPAEGGEVTSGGTSVQVDPYSVAEAVTISIQPIEDSEFASVSGVRLLTEVTPAFNIKISNASGALVPLLKSIRVTWLLDNDAYAAEDDVVILFQDLSANGSLLSNLMFRRANFAKFERGTDHTSISILISSSHFNLVAAAINPGETVGGVAAAGFGSSWSEVLDVGRSSWGIGLHLAATNGLAMLGFPDQASSGRATVATIDANMDISIDAISDYSSGASIAFADSGEGFVLTDRKVGASTSNVQATRRTADGTWQLASPTLLDSGTSSSPSFTIASNSAGMTVAVWTLISEIRAQVYVPGSGWQGTIALADGYYPVVEVSEAGTAVIMAQYGSEFRMWRYADGDWSDFENVNTTAGSGDHRIKLVSDAQGRFSAMLQLNGALSPHLWHMGIDGTWSTTEVGSSIAAQDVFIDVNRDGEGFVGWTEGFTGEMTLKTAPYTMPTTIGTASTLSSSHAQYDPQLAVSQSGHAVLLWRGFQEGGSTGFGTYTKMYDTDLGWGQTTFVGEIGGQALQMVKDGQDTVSAAWIKVNGSLFDIKYMRLE